MRRTSPGRRKPRRRRIPPTVRRRCSRESEFAQRRTPRWTPRWCPLVNCLRRDSRGPGGRQGHAGGLACRAARPARVLLDASLHRGWPVDQRRVPLGTGARLAVVRPQPDGTATIDWGVPGADPPPLTTSPGASAMWPGPPSPCAPTTTSATVRGLRTAAMPVTPRRVAFLDGRTRSGHRRGRRRRAERLTQPPGREGPYADSLSPPCAAPEPGGHAPRRNRPAPRPVRAAG